MIGAIYAAQLKCPEADVFVPIINFSSSIPPREQTVLLHMNNYFLKKTYNHIPALQGDFETEQDLIHWTKTASNILNHWYDHVK